VTPQDEAAQDLVKVDFSPSHARRGDVAPVEASDPQAGHALHPYNFGGRLRRDISICPMPPSVKV
jgi:hypothetical protein